MSSKSQWKRITWEFASSPGQMILTFPWWLVILKEWLNVRFEVASKMHFIFSELGII